MSDEHQAGPPQPREEPAPSRPTAVPDLEESTASDTDDAADAADADTTPETATEAQPDWEALVAQDPRSPAELLAELTEAEARRDEYLDDVRRARAEFENYRRRVMREATTQREAGKADAAANLLEVLDDLDRTLQAAADSDDESLAKGVELVAEKLVKALQDLGLGRIDEVGVPFDPNLHEAVQQRGADEPREEPVVAQVLRPGYRFGDRVLRPAMVVVEQ